MAEFSLSRVFDFFNSIPPIADISGRLKKTLGEVIIVILFVKFLEIALINLTSLTSELLILPGSILQLSLGLKFLELKEQKRRKDTK